VLDESFLHEIGLGGFIHLWGAAGAGKTVLASFVAAEASRNGVVEWINTDSKKSFIRSLRANVDLVGGKMENINVTIAESHHEAKTIIGQLPDIIEDGTNLCVVDTITRTLDFGRNDPTFWGQEFVEVILPVLASHSQKPGFNIIATSECRQLPNSGVVPVLHRTISKWVDHEILVRRSKVKSNSNVLLSRYGSDDERYIATIRPNADGSLRVSRTQTTMMTKEV
jgi:hypothetical protein